MYVLYDMVVCISCMCIVWYGGGSMYVVWYDGMYEYVYILLCVVVKLVYLSLNVVSCGGDGGGGKLLRLQLYTKNYRQGRKARSGRDGLLLRVDQAQRKYVCVDLSHPPCQRP